MKIFHNDVPQAVVKTYSSGKQRVKKRWFSLRASSPKEVVELRDKWISENSDKIILARDTVTEFRKKLKTFCEKYKYGYKNVYKPNKTKAEWRAKLQVYSEQDRSFSYDVRFEAQTLSDRIKRQIPRNSDQPAHQKHIRTVVKNETRRWAKDRQVSALTRSKSGFCFWLRRGGYYRDQAIMLSAKGSRLLRKIRLGVSELAEQSHSKKLSTSSTCRFCTLNADETPSHFLLHCPVFDKHRQPYLKKVRPLLQKCGLTLSAQNLLGMSQTLVRPSVEKNSRTLRENILSQTALFIFKTKRFKKNDEQGLS